MRLKWSLPAVMYFDQLSLAERRRVAIAVDDAVARWDESVGSGLQLLKAPQLSDAPLYSLRVGRDLRVLLSRRADDVTVADIVRRSQIEALRDAPPRRRAGVE